jgi:hypothetical protein
MHTSDSISAGSGVKIDSSIGTITGECGIEKMMVLAMHMEESVENVGVSRGSRFL